MLCLFYIEAVTLQGVIFTVPLTRILKEVEGGHQVKEVCREYGISDATYSNWKSKRGYGSVRCETAEGAGICENIEPESGPFVLRKPQAQQLLVTFQINPQRQIHRFVDYLPVLTDFDDDAVQVNNRVDRIQSQRPRWPFDDLVNHRVSHP